MSTDLIELGRRAVACPKWRWLPGMRWTYPPKPGGYGPLDGGGRLDETEATYLWPPEGAAPDLTDPATLGCLLARVREVHGNPKMYVYFGYELGEWTVSRRDADGYLRQSHAATEAEALVAALEAAP